MPRVAPLPRLRLNRKLRQSSKLIQASEIEMKFLFLEEKKAPIAWLDNQVAKLKLQLNR
jgi:hypothetical protein